MPKCRPVLTSNEVHERGDLVQFERDASSNERTEAPVDGSATPRSRRSPR